MFSSSPLFSNQCERIGGSLRAKGFTAVHFKEKGVEALPYLDALLVLADDRNGNLGWRMVAHVMLTKEDFEEFIRKTADCTNASKTLLPKLIQKTVLSDLKTLIAVIGGKPFDKKNAILLLQRLGYDQDRVIQEFVKVRIGEAESEGSCSPSIRKIPITITTVQGSKGLAADYVFITHFDERYVGKAGVTNQKYLQFLGGTHESPQEGVAALDIR